MQLDPLPATTAATAAQHWSRSDPESSQRRPSDPPIAATIQTIVQQDQPKIPKSRNYSGIPHVQSDQQLDELSEICHHKFVEETNGAEGNIDGENRKIYNILVQITNRPDKNFSFAVNNQMSSV